MKFSKILVPTDFSGHANAALDHAVELADRFGAELIVLHAVEPPVYPALTFAGAANLPTVVEGLVEACEKKLAELVDGLPDGVQARPVTAQGQPFQVIAEVAEEQGVDLIVIATHGYTGIKHFMLGSTAERVVRMSKCPVLTVRTPGD